MARRSRPAFDWRRWPLGGRNSWRRVVLAGIGGGVALALLAALVSALVGGGSGSLDDEEPTAAAPVFVPVDDEPITTEPPGDEPPAPTLVPPTEAPPERSPTIPEATSTAESEATPIGTVTPPLPEPTDIEG